MFVTRYDLLSREEFKDYRSKWDAFEGRYVPLTSYETHSGLPVIGKVMQYKGIFRAYVFGKRLRKFDPHFIASESIAPYWEGIHYSISGLQMFAASQLILFGDGRDRLSTLETHFELTLRKKIYWTDNISIEMILSGGHISMSYIDEGKDMTVARASAKYVTGKREYFKTLERLSMGEKEAKEQFLRQLSQQEHIRRRILNHPLEDSEAEDISAMLVSGTVPEERIHKFFSLYPK